MFMPSEVTSEPMVYVKAEIIEEKIVTWQDEFEKLCLLGPY